MSSAKKAWMDQYRRMVALMNRLQTRHDILSNRARISNTNVINYTDFNDRLEKLVEESS